MSYKKMKEAFLKGKGKLRGKAVHHIILDEVGPFDVAELVKKGEVKIFEINGVAPLKAEKKTAPKVKAKTTKKKTTPKAKTAKKPRVATTTKATKTKKK